MVLIIIFASSAKADEQIALKAENYLNSLTTMSADFTQVDASGNAAGGKFALKRPGKFRWEYDQRQPLEIVSDGSELVYYDKKLKEVTHADLKDSLAGFLARKNVKFTGDVKLISANARDGAVRVKLTQKDKPEQGNLVMVFDSGVSKLIGLEIEDQNGGVTKIVFSNTKFGQEIPDREFVFVDPKYSRNVWERQ